MSVNIKLRKGLDINLAGKAENKLVEELASETFAIKPPDFLGFEKPKVLVKVGDTVKAGDPLYYDKSLEEVKYTSPVSGEVVEVKRGAKRRLLEIIVRADKDIQYKEFKHFSASEISSLSEEQVKEALLEGGVWPNFIQRPFGIIPNPSQTPKAIFISGFDSAPLAPDYDFIYQGQEEAFAAGVEALKKLTKGTVHLNLGPNGTKVLKAKGAQVNNFSGPHPAGNVGVQIHHIDPINKGDLAYTIKPYGVIQIGKLLLSGKYDASKVVALAGSEVEAPQYYKTYAGASIKGLIDGKIKTENVRYISGNVLSGSKVDADSHLGYYDELLTVIPEGNNLKFFGSFDPTTDRHSVSRSIGLLSFLNPKSKEYSPDTNINGEHRAFVQTGVFETVMPMDILPTQLVKSVLYEDFDEMEALGLYEVIEEDLALCEYVDVSKNEIQSIIRQGIDLMLNS